METKPLERKIWMPIGMFDHEIEVGDTFKITGNTMTKISETKATFKDRTWEFKTEGQEYFGSLYEVNPKYKQRKK